MESHLLALDLDGTSVNDQGKLSPEDRDALAEIRNRGHKVCFATGRRDIDMFSSWEVCRYADFLLLNNGGKLLRAADCSLIFNHCITPSASQELILYCLREGLQLHIISGEYWGVSRWTSGLQEYTDFLGTAPVIYESLGQTPWDHVEAMMATSDLVPVCHYIDEHHLPLTHILSEDNCADITASDLGKWKGIQQLSTLLGIDKSRVITAGDYLNDVEMIREAGIGVAVANALPEVRASADYVTIRDHNHSAITEIIEKFL